ncbi:hypothetical protein HYH03_004881 [Edaphochlamys debaryana]|uniref:DUF155 domain-containing protein n=1 Tax=Edaphochlamys debaryana TaxID=47281 RepID=A0A835Y765_9CHLO|nr:hypothetical protein HYH03_004881 [Edaphochlamys debaryana]|eukprot:KAG2497298.1 hypothetical protein HYH03_004881 [Edaphochlamys debaryana]
MSSRAETSGGAYAPLDAGPSSSAGPRESSLGPEYKLKQRPSASQAPTGGDRAAQLRRSNSISYKAVLGSELAAGIRQRDKFVPLPLESSRAASPGRPEEQEGSGRPFGEIGGLEPPGLLGRARLTVYCVAEALDREKLVSLLRIKHPGWETHAYEDVVHARLPAPYVQGGGYGQYTGGGGLDDTPPSASTSLTSAQAVGAPDVFFFEYGVVAFWGMQQSQEASILRSLAKAVEQGPLPRYDMDEFAFNISGSEPPHIQNDTITINRRQATDHRVRLAISHALAQSTKLSVYEERVVALVEESRHLPQDLAAHGRVSMSTKKLAQLIGKVFLQSSTLNLLSTVMDTPEFFWSAPDHLQALYERACEYLELDTRAEVLNARFEVLQEMLDMLRDHKNNSHAARLEWIIIWLLLVDVILMLFQLLSLFGLV